MKAAAATLGTPAVFVAMSPCRVMDTRNPDGPYGGPAFAAGETRTYPIPSGPCAGVPASAVAFSLNIAVIPLGTTMRWLTAWDTGSSQPNASTLNDKAGLTTSNSAVVPAGTSGSIDVFVTDSTNVIIDINGYYAPPSTLPLTGTAAAPALTFGDTTTGLYSDTTGTVSIATGGSNRLTVRADGDLELPGSIRKGGIVFLSAVGQENTGVGINTLAVNTGADNTATGYLALADNTTGSSNTATGTVALRNNTTGIYNTATGVTALVLNTVGQFNTATGVNALFSNTGGDWNTATGVFALEDNTASNNTATGFSALKSNTDGSANTGIGSEVLSANTTGGNNTAIGFEALDNLNGGNNNIGIGIRAGQQLVAGSSDVYIANQGSSNESNTIRIGDIHDRAFIAGVRGATTGNADAIPVVIDSNGQLGTASSSRRVKRDIQDMGDTTDTILALHPVRFRYTQHAPGSPLQYGLIAEEVAEVAPDLVARNKDGEIETVYYDKVTAMLLNEVQKLHRENEAQKREFTEALRKLEDRLAEVESRAN